MRMISSFEKDKLKIIYTDTKSSHKYI